VLPKGQSSINIIGVNIVSGGIKFYGVGGGYHHFAGRDGSRAFVSGNFKEDGLHDNLDGLTHDGNPCICPYQSCYYYVILIWCLVDGIRVGCNG
jgi:hypothetical protein